TLPREGEVLCAFSVLAALQTKRHFGGRRVFSIRELPLSLPPPGDSHSAQSDYQKNVGSLESRLSEKVC
ncbi:MAG: hypothetical protein KDB27_35035, partial [Planctomycetales bacterium]|nr:hypothetical protein [Planctomycetales bacterium]